MNKTVANEVENLESKIIETAKQLFVENGYSQTSMSEIALAVGINRPTLHYYFRTKDKLFSAVYTPILESFLPKIEGIVIEDSPFEKKIEKVADAYFSLYMENPFLPQFVIGESQRDADNLIATAQNLNIDKYVLAMRGMVKNEIKEGRIKEVPTRVLFLAFIGQIVTPFLAKNLILKLFDLDEEGYRKFIEEWKQHTLKQLKQLLLI